jgi:hypothetical protein
MTFELEGLTGGGQGGVNIGNGNGKGTRNKKNIKPATLRAYKYTTMSMAWRRKSFWSVGVRPNSCGSRKNNHADTYQFDN